MHPNLVNRRRLLQFTAAAGGFVLVPIVVACGSGQAVAPTSAPSANNSAPAPKPPAPTVAKAAAPPAPQAAASPAASASPAGNAAFTFKISSSLPTGDNETWVMGNGFANLINQKSNGKIKATNFPNNQLGEEAQVIQQIKLGTIEMFSGGLAIWATLVPEVACLDMGYLFDDINHMGRVLDGEAGQLLSKMVLDRTGAQIVAWGFSYGFRNILSRKPVKTVDDLRGLKVRVLPNPNYVATLKLMGASPDPIAFGEIYTSLQTGVINALEHNAPTILTSKFYEVAKNMTLTQHIIGPVVLVVGKKKLDQLPPDLQTTFLAAAKQAQADQRSREPVIEGDAFKALKGFGVITYPIDRATLRKKVEPLWTEFSNKYPSVKPILDAINKARQ